MTLTEEPEAAALYAMIAVPANPARALTLFRNGMGGVTEPVAAWSPALRSTPRPAGALASPPGSGRSRCTILPSGPL